MRTCRACNVSKDESNFHKAAGNPDGLNWTCRDCRRDKRRARYAANPEKYAAARRATYLKNYEKELAYNKAAALEWQKRNPERVRANNARRRSMRLSATPPWVSEAEVDWFYRLAVVLEEITGIKHHVDHIEPLQGLDRCGLHVPMNLRILPARVNLKKGRKVVRSPKAASAVADHYVMGVLEQAIRDGVLVVDKKCARALSNG